ncbi:PPOX class F420-dependent oxidoreductase [Nocardiopsis suaedae]|uniref:PPOX class F420-dependent oxidoreductase n=1 Tax=Nocardiopsis suaedae TaxID=3018444 RepID=A0ABT4TP17_9ACTN|nr:PPOX class F420-dependent oxidoreductase [Nocardiopsis suaedae]MDA2806423.1 PPOX class F420-dependent oxidoreductase [Nocardiopsis suaedae]
MNTATLLKPFRGHKTALLTTYRSDGVTGVDTPVSIVVDGARILFRTWEDSGKAKRLRNNPVADLRPCSFRGEPHGPPVRGRVRLLDDAEARHAALLLGKRHPMLQRWAVPATHRLLRYRTLHYEIIPFDREEIASNEGCPD